MSNKSDILSSTMNSMQNKPPSVSPMIKPIPKAKGYGAGGYSRMTNLTMFKNMGMNQKK